MFSTTGFDLPAYLQRIGCTGPAEPTLETLRAVTLLHPQAIPFENLDPFCRVVPSLDLAALQQKMVHGGRGGWCYEHNFLLGAALTAIGFEPIGLAARVVWNMPEQAWKTRSHMVLLLTIDGEPWIADAGFGGLTLTAPLRLTVDAVQETPHERFRLRARGDDLALEAFVQGAWRPLYLFDRQQQWAQDYQAMNWYLATHPQSHFLSTLIAARVDGNRRYALRNVELATHTVGGATERRILATPADLRAALETTFGIAVPRDPATEDALARVTAGAVQPA